MTPLEITLITCSCINALGVALSVFNILRGKNTGSELKINTNLLSTIATGVLNFAIDFVKTNLLHLPAASTPAPTSPATPEPSQSQTLEGGATSTPVTEPAEQLRHLFRGEAS